MDEQYLGHRPNLSVEYHGIVIINIGPNFVDIFVHTLKYTCQYLGKQKKYLFNIKMMLQSYIIRD